MRKFEQLKEKYKDGWWEGHDGYTGDDMVNDIEFLIGFGEGSLIIDGELNRMRRKLDEVKKKLEVALYHQSQMQTVIDTYEEALQQIVDIGNKTYYTESEVIAKKILKFYEE